MAPILGMLAWKDTDSLGKTGRGGEEGTSPLSVSEWLQCVGLCLGTDEELTELMGQDYREGKDRGHYSGGLLEAT